MVCFLSSFYIISVGMYDMIFRIITNGATYNFCGSVKGTGFDYIFSRLTCIFVSGLQSSLSVRLFSLFRTPLGFCLFGEVLLLGS